MAMRVNHILSICEYLFLALNRFSLVALVVFFYPLLSGLLGLLGLLAGRRGLVFGPLAARLFALSMGHAQDTKTPLAFHKFQMHHDKYEKKVGCRRNPRGRFPDIGHSGSKYLVVITVNPCFDVTLMQKWFLPHIKLDFKVWLWNNPV
jgi:hypothetical protein